MVFIRAKPIRCSLLNDITLGDGASGRLIPVKSARTFADDGVPNAETPQFRDLSRVSFGGSFCNRLQHGFLFRSAPGIFGLEPRSGKALAVACERAA
jgi:hypothetical protein